MRIQLKVNIVSVIFTQHGYFEKSTLFCSFLFKFLIFTFSWGMLTFKESSLLIDNKSSTSSSKQWVALLVAHEIAHQWFGNIVTMEWWTHLWLNEGFASWMEYLATDYCYPEWNIWKQFIYEHMSRGFKLDSLKSSHPIEIEVNHPSEIDEIFDSISYSKGSSIIRMLYTYLGENHFKKALNKYLIKYQYKNATTNDLWNILTKVSKKPVKEIMSTWTTQMGYPVITISCNNENNKLKIIQSSFSENSSYLWSIPISIFSDCSLDSPLFYLLNEKEMEIEIPKYSSWFKINFNQTGFYRVHYLSENILDNIINAIQSNQLNSIPDRLGIQNDSIALAYKNIISTVQAFKVIEAYKNEKDYYIWADITKNLSKLLYHLYQEIPDSSLQINNFGISIYSSVFQFVGWDGNDSDDDLIKQLRALAIRQLAFFGDLNIINEARNRFKNDDFSSISPDLKAAIIEIVLEHGDENDFQSILSIIRQSDFQEEKERYMVSLGCIRDPNLLEKTLQFALSSEVRSQDVGDILCSVSNNIYGRDIAWNFLKKNWDTLHQAITGGFILKRIITTVIGNFSSLQKLEEIKHFCDQKKYFSNTLTQALELIHSNNSWLSSDIKKIEQFFSNYE